MRVFHKTKVPSINRIYIILWIRSQFIRLACKKIMAYYDIKKHQKNYIQNIAF